MTEEQVFWLLTVLCDRFLPGYYSVNMVGVIIDNQVFESLVFKFMPSISEHFKKYDIQLSIVCLPWFLSLFINSFPITLAFRVLDCFFLHGPPVLFQLGLGILKANAEKLMKAKDDGEVMNIFKEYFATSEEQVLTKTFNNNNILLMKFNALLLSALRDYKSVTYSLILKMRKSHQFRVIHSIQLYKKRSDIRDLKNTSHFTNEDLSKLYDQFYTAIFYGRNEAANATGHEKMDLMNFQVFISQIASWGHNKKELKKYEMQKEHEKRKLEKKRSKEILLNSEKSNATDEDTTTTTTLNETNDNNDSEVSPISNTDISPSSSTSSSPVNTKLDRNALVGFNFLKSLFDYFDKKHQGYLEFQDIVNGIGEIKFGDLLSHINLLFYVHDTGHKGYLNREDIISLGETLLFLCRKMDNDQHLSAVSDLMKDAFDLSDELKEKEKELKEKQKMEEMNAEKNGEDENGEEKEVKEEKEAKEEKEEVKEEVKEEIKEEEVKEEKEEKEIKEEEKIDEVNNEIKEKDYKDRKDGYESPFIETTLSSTQLQLKHSSEDLVQIPLSSFRILIIGNSYFEQYFNEFKNTINFNVNIAANVEGVKTEILEVIWKEGVKWAKKRVQPNKPKLKTQLSPDGSQTLSPPSTAEKNSRQNITYTYSTADDDGDEEETETDSMKQLLDNMDMNAIDEAVHPDNINNLFNPFN